MPFLGLVFIWLEAKRLYVSDKLLHWMRWFPFQAPFQKMHIYILCINKIVVKEALYPSSRDSEHLPQKLQYLRLLLQVFSTSNSTKTVQFLILPDLHPCVQTVPLNCAGSVFSTHSLDFTCGITLGKCCCFVFLTKALSRCATATTPSLKGRGGSHCGKVGNGQRGRDEKLCPSRTTIWNKIKR